MPHTAFGGRLPLPAGHPFEFQCPRVGGGVDDIDDDETGICESVVPSGLDFVNIVINSANDSTAADISEVADNDDRLVLQIIDRAAYNLGATNEHRVAIISPPIIRVAAASASPTGTFPQTPFRILLPSLGADGRNTIIDAFVRPPDDPSAVGWERVAAPGPADTFTLFNQ